MMGDLNLFAELSHLPSVRFPRAVKAAEPSRQQVQEKREVGALGSAVSHLPFPRPSFPPFL